MAIFNWKNISPWAGNRKPTPFSAEPGVHQMPMETQLGHPFGRDLVLDPAYQPQPRPPRLAKRKSPGHPGCPDCRASKGGQFIALDVKDGQTFAYAGQLPAGACESHRSYFHQTEALWGIG